MPITTDAILQELREVERDCDTLKKRIDNLLVMALSKRDRDNYLNESAAAQDASPKPEPASAR